MENVFGNCQPHAEWVVHDKTQEAEKRVEDGKDEAQAKGSGRRPEKGQKQQTGGPPGDMQPSVRRVPIHQRCQQDWRAESDGGIEVE